MARKLDIGDKKKKPAKRKKAMKVPELEVGRLHIFTDGSCYPNPGPGGWGCMLIWPQDGMAYEQFPTMENYGGSPNQTNNTMELTAIKEGLLLRKRQVPTTVYSDSKLCINSLTRWWQGWERNGWITAAGDPVKNQELIKEILDILKTCTGVRFQWVKGHAGIYYNERVDTLANQGRKEYGNRQAVKTRKTEIEAGT